MALGFHDQPRLTKCKILTVVVLGAIRSAGATSGLTRGEDKGVGVFSVYLLIITRQEGAEYAVKFEIK